MKDIIDLSRKEPELFQINENVDHQEGTKISLKKDGEYIKSTHLEKK